MNFITTTFKRTIAFIARYANKRTAIALLIVVAFLGFGLIKGFFSPDAAQDAEATARQVTVSPAGLISQLEAVFETTGEIKSQTQGDLRAQRAGVITRVYKKVGQRVSAGTIIATIENASESASVAQAQAGVAQAQASLNKVQGGTRDEQLAVLAASTASAQQSLDEALIAVKNTLLNAYASTDSIFIGGIDSMFDDADSANPELLFVTTNSSQALSAEHSRLILQTVIDRHAVFANRIAILDAPATLSEIQVVEGEILKVKKMLDNLISALDGAVPNASVSTATIASYKTTANAARSTTLATLSSLSSARASINGAKSALTVAQENEALGVSGSQLEDVEVAQAQLSSAKATLAQSVAQLEKTRVRAPVSGEVTILTVNPGDFVSSFQDIGLIANSSTLEVVTYLPQSAVERLNVGGQALIDETHTGVITSIALGLDPVKRQVEVRVALLDTEIPLTHGTRTSVRFLNAEITEIAADAKILIPVSALKLVGSEAFVFTVDADKKLVSNKVILGSVIQSSVEILNGITHTTAIVLDARGLNAGDTVIVSN